MLVTSPVAIPKLRKATLPAQSGRDALVTSLSALLDRSLMRTVTLVVERRILPRDVDLDMLRESIHAMLATGLVDNAGDFFDFVAGLESGEAPGCTELDFEERRRIRGGRVYRCDLTSSHRHSTLLAPSGQDVEEGDTIQVDYWVHDHASSLGTVILLHGFAMGWPVIDAVALKAKEWFERGFDVVMLTLPDHGPRRPEGRVFSGQNYTVPHAVLLAAAVRQAVHEIFELKRWLREQGDKPVGLVGMSLGGYLASLCAGLSKDFDFIVPLVPPACMGDLAWRVYRDTGHHRSGMDETLTEENMRAAFYVHSPLAHPRKIDTERILIVAGAGDRIVPPEHPSALWEHWDRPDIHWFRGSHIAPVANGSLIQLLTQHLEKLGIA
jgi:pimeloyl-ACP methyl ester carboxylesterase